MAVADSGDEIVGPPTPPGAMTGIRTASAIARVRAMS